MPTVHFEFSGTGTTEIAAAPAAGTALLIAALIVGNASSGGVLLRFREAGADRLVYPLSETGGRAGSVFPTPLVLGNAHNLTCDYISAERVPVTCIFDIVARPNVPDPPVAPDGLGGYWLTGDDWRAHVASDGLLDSWPLGAVEMIDRKPRFSSGLSWPGDHFLATEDTLISYSPSADFPGLWNTLTYTVRGDGITLTLHHRSNAIANLEWVPRPTTLLGVELLNDKGVALAGDMLRFVTSGEVRALPPPIGNLFNPHIFTDQRNQWVRFHYPGKALDLYSRVWAGGFSYEAVGMLDQATSDIFPVFRRSLLGGFTDHTFVFTVSATGETATLPAVSFAPRTPHVCALYLTSEPCTWNIDLGPRARYQYLLDAGITSLDLSWELFDVRDQSVGTGTGTVTLSTGSGTTQAVTITPPGTGYYGVLFRLADPSGRMRESSFRTRLTRIRAVAGKTNRDDTLTPGNPHDAGVIAMIGVGGLRESVATSTYFRLSDPADATNWVTVPGASPTVWAHQAALDTLFNTASTQAATYGLTWWFQLVTARMLSTTQLRAAAAYLVGRYKDRCTTWEIENEPETQGISPSTWATEELIPFSLGIADAGGGVTLMGPASGSAPSCPAYLQAAYDAGAGSAFQAVSLHTYPGPGESWEQFGNIAYLQAVRDLLDSHGDTAKPIWQTEQGYRWDLAPKAEAARYSVRQFLQGWAHGIPPEHQYYFYPIWHGFESWYTAGGGPEGARDSWLPNAAAMRMLAENLHGGSFSAALSAPHPGIFLFRFSGGDDDVIVAWTYDFAYTLAFDCATLVRVEDWMGNAVTPGTAGGHQTLPLSGEPHYLHLASGGAFTVASPAFGTDFARSTQGSTATASSTQVGSAAANAIDGGATTYNERTFWSSTAVAPTPGAPHWLQVDFGTSRTISRFLGLTPLPAIDSAPRDWQFQVDVAGSWQTVASGADEFTWSFYREFTPVATTRVRWLITETNDGWHRDRAWTYILDLPGNYTTRMTRVIALEVYA